MNLIIILFLFGGLAVVLLSSKYKLNASHQVHDNLDSFPCGLSSSVTGNNLKPSPGTGKHARMEKFNIERPLVGIIMGSKSDWETMSHASQTLEKLGIPYEVEVVSAHRTPDKLFSYAESAEEKGLEVLIAGAGGAAHLPGMAASKCLIPVLGVPVQSKVLNGIDSLLSIVQMPAGIPVGTLAIGRAGAVNAALLAAAMLGRSYSEIRDTLAEFRKTQTETVLAEPDPRNQDS